jgi:hypothetical protein
LDICGYDIPKNVKAYDIVNRLLDAFEMQDGGAEIENPPERTEDERDNAQPMNLNLSTFPDVAPSTLFGEDWLKDILARRSLRRRATGTDGRNVGSFDGGISVNGVFGETEQWLWTANRGLRKLRAVLDERNEEYEKRTPRKRVRREEAETRPAPRRSRAKG